jgi:hypothetical protein
MLLYEFLLFSSLHCISAASSETNHSRPKCDRASRVVDSKVENSSRNHENFEC